MRVLYSMLCENASLQHDGRLNVHGIFTQLQAGAFPARQDEMTLVVVIEWGPDERGKIPFSIDFLDPDRAPIGTIQASTDVSDPPPMSGPPQTPLIMPLQGVTFRTPGAYEFELKIGDEKQMLTRLYLIENPSVRPQQG